jgi:GMP synthase PP-ATPase subunit
MAKGKKTGGRQTGSKNRYSRLDKEIIADLLSEYAGSGLMATDFAHLEAKDRLQIAERLMQYTMPRMQSTAVDLTLQPPATIEDTLTSLS